MELWARTGSDMYHFHSLMAVYYRKGGWEIVPPKKIWVDDQPLGQRTQLKTRVLLSRKKRGWILGDR